jgi:hypothetical protein
LALRKIVGYFHRFLPTNVVQAFAKGLYLLVEKKEEFLRTHNFDDGLRTFLPLSSLRNLGHDIQLVHFAASQSVRASCKPRAAGGVRGLLSYKAYVEKKHQTCGAYAIIAPR